MKTIFILVSLTTFIFANNVSCKNSLVANSIYNFSKLENSSILSVGGEIEENQVVGDLDPANSSIEYYDNTSPICGGSGKDNILIYAYCPHHINKCWDINLGVSGLSLITKKDTLYTNNVVIANNTPCLPRNISNITVAYYDYDNNDIGFANLNLLAIEDEYITTPTESEAKQQRQKCSSIIKYVDDWENLLDSQKASLDKSIIDIKPLDIDNNSKFENISDSFSLDTNIDSSLLDFESTIKTHITNSFSKYSDVFGFGSYGNTPKPITFTLLGKAYPALDLSLYEEHMPLIRNTFLSFSYLWGFILFIRDFL